MDCQHREAPAGSGLAHVESGEADEQSPNKRDDSPSLGAKRPRGRPRRVRPDGFASAYIQFGEEALPDYYRAGKRAVLRWLDELGREELRSARKAHVAAQRRLDKHDRLRRLRRAALAGGAA